MTGMSGAQNQRYQQGAHDDSTLVQQVLSSQMEKVEQWLYHELFETKFVVKDRACRTIIVNESCNNFVSLDLVEKLELLTQPNPQPYYIKWFNSCGKFKVNRIVRINFSIGDYHDTVNFDLVPMQACSLLFGQPWVFANNGSHNFVANTYTFRHNGRKMKLVPMSFTEIFEDNLERMKIGIDEIFRDTRKDAIVMSSTKSELQNECIVVPIVLDTNILLASENNQGNEKEKKDEEEKDLSIAPCMLEECSIDQALIISEDEKKGNDNGATATQEAGSSCVAIPPKSTVYQYLSEDWDLTSLITLGTMLRAILKKKLKMWEECLSHVEFAYNRATHSTTKVSPFQVVYGFNPRAPIDILPLPTSERVHNDVKAHAEFILKMHESTKLNIEKMTEKYRIAGSKGTNGGDKETLGEGLRAIEDHRGHLSQGGDPNQVDVGCNSESRTSLH
uniref:Gag-pol polyprotein n=1 Tax=Oryza sativa subsp. japonica TaxID=39947 RepID=Q8H860_ORYSJ|nr:putative gag-pol polyprotein [Oryza sativa Japonica Group]